MRVGTVRVLGLITPLLSLLILLSLSDRLPSAPGDPAASLLVRTNHGSSFATRSGSQQPVTTRDVQLPVVVHDVEPADAAARELKPEEVQRPLGKEVQLPLGEEVQLPLGEGLQPSKRMPPWDAWNVVERLEAGSLEEKIEYIWDRAQALVKEDAERFHDGVRPFVPYDPPYSEWVKAQRDDVAQALGTSRIYPSLPGSAASVDWTYVPWRVINLALPFSGEVLADHIGSCAAANHLSLPLEHIAPKPDKVPSSGFYPRELSKAARGDKRIYVSLDGSPSDWSPLILNSFAAFNASLTSFMLGWRANMTQGDMSSTRENYQPYLDWERVLNEFVQAGHTVGSHTFNHPDVTTLSAEEFVRELSLIQHVFFERVGPHVLSTFRFPNGVSGLTGALGRVLELHGVPFHWDHPTGDAQSYVRGETQDPLTTDPSSDKLIGKIKGIVSKYSSAMDTGNSHVMLGHDRYASTAIAMPLVLSLAKQRGYRMVGLEELVELEFGTSSLELISQRRLLARCLEERADGGDGYVMDPSRLRRPASPFEANTDRSNERSPDPVSSHTIKHQRNTVAVGTTTTHPTPVQPTALPPPEALGPPAHHVEGGGAAADTAQMRLLRSLGDREREEMLAAYPRFFSAPCDFGAVQDPADRFVAIKTPKCGTVTLCNSILLKHAREHGLLVPSKSRGGKDPWAFNSDNTKAEPGAVHAWCHHHSEANWEWVSSLVQPSGHGGRVRWVLALREPYLKAVSWFNHDTRHGGFPVVGGDPVESMKQYMRTEEIFDNHIAFYGGGVDAVLAGLEAMWHDEGAPSLREHTGPYELSAVVMLERYEESLVALKFEMGWSLRDMLWSVGNQAGGSAIKPQQLGDEFREWMSENRLQHDYAIYNLASEKLTHHLDWLRATRSQECVDAAIDALATAKGDKRHPLHKLE